MLPFYLIFLIGNILGPKNKDTVTQNATVSLTGF